MKKIYSPFYYPIEYYNPHAHLEYDFNKKNMNEAEMKALEQEEYKSKFNQIKEIKQKEYFQKYQKSALLYEEEQRMKNREEMLNKKREQDEQILKKKNYNETVYQKNMRPFIKEKQKELKAKIKKKKIKSLDKKENKTKNVNKEENQLVYNTINQDNRPDLDDSDNLDNKKLLNNLAENISDNENIKFNTLDNGKNDLESNVVDLRVNLENQLLEEIKNKNNILKNAEIKDELEDKISTIKKFRTYGFLPENAPELEQVKNKKKSKNKKFPSEFEKRRFIKALKNIITERLGEHNIYIQNICSCGNLQKQLTALVEKGNFTVYALTDVECANNCIFYKNKKAYLKNINDVLKSVKDIAYENFNNKYKNKK